MQLFTDQVRNYSGPITAGQSYYEWLDRSSLPEAAAARSTLQTWFDEFPKALKVELRGRFQDKRRVQHQSATLELYLHALLSRLRYDVAPPPPFEGSTPEFSAMIDGTLVHFEAVAFEVEPDREDVVGAANAVLDSIGQYVENQCVEIDVDGWTEGAQQCSAKALARQLVVLFEKEVTDGNLEHNGWRFRVALHRRDVPRHNPNRIWRFVNHGTRSVPERERLQETLLRKAAQHRTRLKADGGTLVVAFAHVGRGGDLCELSIMQALAGSIAANLNSGIESLQKDGLWSRHAANGKNPSEPSAVLQVMKLDACALAKSEVVLWVNPNATRIDWRKAWPLNRRGWDVVTGEPFEIIANRAADVLGASK